jgi:hypothetical protein
MKNKTLLLSTSALFTLACGSATGTLGQSHSNGGLDTPEPQKYEPPAVLSPEGEARVSALTGDYINCMSAATGCPAKTVSLTQGAGNVTLDGHKGRADMLDLLFDCPDNDVSRRVFIQPTLPLDKATTEFRITSSILAADTACATTLAEGLSTAAGEGLLSAQKAAKPQGTFAACAEDVLSCDTLLSSVEKSDTAQGLSSFFTCASGDTVQISSTQPLGDDCDGTQSVTAVRTFGQPQDAATVSAAASALRATVSTCYPAVKLKPCTP